MHNHNNLSSATGPPCPAAKSSAFGVRALVAVVPLCCLPPYPRPSFIPQRNLPESRGSLHPGPRRRLMPTMCLLHLVSALYLHPYNFLDLTFLTPQLASTISRAACCLLPPATILKPSLRASSVSSSVLPPFPASFRSPPLSSCLPGHP
ncbi:hypothetical protein FKM82_009609 [Ascaphus truei]